LLNGSSFNYVMLGSSSDPTAVSSVILTAKPSASGETQPAPPVYQSESASTPPSPVVPFRRQLLVGPGGRPALPPGAAAENEDSNKDKDKDDDDSADDADDQAQPDKPAQPDANSANGNQDQPQPPDPNQPNAGPKTPEQILDMLRRQQPPGAPPIPPQQPPQD
jgi:hypothetical protein